MADFTYTIGTTTSGGNFVNDGSAGGGYIFDSQNQAQFNNTTGVWTVFKGITIPRYTNIISADFIVHAIYTGGSFNFVTLVINGNPTAGIPTASTQVRSPGPPKQSKSFIWATYVPTPNTITLAVPTGSPNSKPAYSETTHNVQPLVHNLVQLNDYSNDNMVVYLNKSNSGTNLVYLKDWDTGGGKSPKLVISYLVETDKTAYQFV